MTGIEDVLAEHYHPPFCDAPPELSCDGNPVRDIRRCKGCEYLVKVRDLDCPRCAQDRLLERLRILLRLELPLDRIDTNPEGTYADGFVDGKVAQMEHDMEIINKILGVTNK